MSDYETSRADEAAARHDDAMEREHRLLGHDDPTDYEHCYLCVELLAFADEHARGEHVEPVDGCRGCEEYDDDAMVVEFPPCETETPEKRYGSGAGWTLADARRALGQALTEVASAMSDTEPVR